jgi:lipopolysaccharide export LptBFGC system permease protein LptF
MSCLGLRAHFRHTEADSTTPLTIIDRYILRQIAVPTALAFLVIAFLAIAGKLGEEVRNLRIEFLTSFDVVRLALYFLPSLISLVIPIAYLIGVLMAYGRLTQTNEIVAMQAGGISLGQILRPALAAGVAFIFVCIAIQEIVQPWTLARAYRFQYVELPLRLTIDALKPGEMHEFGSWRVYFRAKDVTTRTLYDVDILAPEKDGRSIMYFAKMARVVSSGGRYTVEIDKANIAYPSGKSNVALGRFTGTLPVPDVQLPRGMYDRAMHPLRHLFEMERITQLAREMGAGWTQDVVNDIQKSGGDISKSTLVPETLRAKYPIRATVNLNALSALLDNKADRFSESLRETRQEIGKRIATPFACITVTLLGVSLAVRSRHGARSRSYAIGVAIIFGYFAMRAALDPKSLHSLPDVLLRAMAPNIVFLILGLIALRRASRV